MKLNGKVKIAIILSVIVLVIGIVFFTYANQTWGSDNNTEFETTIGDIASITFEKGNNVNVSNMGPVLDYNDGASTEFSILNRTGDDISLSISLSVLTIDSELLNNSFKYVLTKYNDNYDDYDIISSGDFSNFIIGSNLIFSDSSIDSGYNYYKFYVYIDGNQFNDSSMMGKSMTSNLVVSAE